MPPPAEASSADPADSGLPAERLPAERLYERWSASEGGSASFEELCEAHPTLASELRAILRGERIVRQVQEARPRPTGPAEVETGPRYRHLGELGRGGMGRVLRVHDERLGRELALKAPLTEAGEEGAADQLAPERLRRFLAEARITARLSHPNIVPLHDLDSDAEGRPFFTLKLVHGRTLAEVFRLAREEREGWTFARAIELLVRVCEALAHAHERGVVHRDLKPANVMVGAPGELYVMDWGLARELEREDERDLRIACPLSGDSPLVTLDGHVLGTPVYMAPEQARGRLDEVGPRSDVYAVGALLYELLTGRQPFADPDGRTPKQPYVALARVLAGPPEPVRALAPRAPAELESICERAMAREPAARYATMRELAADLRAWLEGRVVRAHASGAWPELRKWVGRNRGVAAGIGASAGLLVLALLLWRSLTGAVLLAAEEKQRTEIERRSAYVSSLEAARLALHAGDPKAARDRLADAPSELRDFEWRALAAPSSSPGEVLIPAELPLRSIVACAEDRIAVGRGTRLELIDPRSGAAAGPPREIGSRIVSLAAPADASWLALGIDGRSPLLLDLEGAGQPLELAAVESTPRRTSSVSLSPDGTRLASAHLGKKLRVWSIAEAREVAALEAGVQVYAVAWSPDGELLAAAARPQMLVLDARSMSILRRLEDSPADFALAWSPSGDRLASGGIDGIVRVWRPRAGELQARLEGHRALVLSLAWSADQSLLASGDEAGDVRLWSPDGSRVPRVLGNFAARVVALAFVDDALIVAGGDGSVRRVPLEVRSEPARLVGRHPIGPSGGAPAAALAFDPSGRMLASGGDDSVIHLWDVLRGERRRSFVHEDRIEALAWTADGLRLVSASADDTLGLWSPDADEPLARLRGHQGDVTDVVLLDERTALSCSADGSLRRWDLQAGEPIGAPISLGPPLRRLALAPGGLLLAAGAEDGTLIFLEGRTLSETARLACDAPVRSLAFLDATRIAVGLASGSLRFVHARSLETETRPGFGRDEIHSLATSPSGRRLIVVDGAPSFLETEARTELLRLPGLGTQPTISAAFSPDGRRLALGTLGGEVLVLDAGEER